MPRISFAPKDEPLREDVRSLGALLGEVIKEQEGEESFRRVEAARLASRRRREGDPDAEGELEAGLSGLDVGEALLLVRAFSQYFSLVNMAERIHRVRRLREALREEAAPAPGSLMDVMQRLARAGVPAASVRRLAGELDLEPVFTAHPSEATRLELLRKEQRVAEVLLERVRTGAPVPLEEEAQWGRIREAVTAAWQTPERRSQRPTVADEADRVLFYLSEVVYKVLPAFHESLERALQRAWPGAPEPDRELLPRVRCGSWVGGDMDGNPEVGPDTIMETLERQQELVVGRYLEEVQRLAETLTQGPPRVEVSGELTARTDELAGRHPAAWEALGVEERAQPYRAFLALVAARLRATTGEGEAGYPDAAELDADVALVLESLLAHGGARAGAHRVRRLRRRVRAFGLHLARLDLRQDARVLRPAVAGLLGRDDLFQKSLEERCRLIQEAPARDGARPPETARALQVMEAVARARRRFGHQALGAFVISMARGPDDALAVLRLAREGGVVDAGGRVPLDVCPLFETLQDLRGAAGTLERLAADPVYAAHLKARGGRQMIMIGYSDSAKQSGLAASRWGLYRAQEELVTVQGPELVFFHGRGGTASRGGSRPRQAVLAEPRAALEGGLRVTEQGEIIHAKYGLPGTAQRTLELMGGAMLEALAGHGPRGPEPSWTACMDLVAAESRRAYEALLAEEILLRYFRAATPVDVIERLRIGSRPPSRGRAAGLEDLRAIPWVFAWTQSRLVLPGWYGVGAGLARAREAHGLDTLRCMARDWPLVANMLADVEMVLAKADPAIAARYAELAGEDGERLFPRLREAFDRTRQELCLVLQVDELLDGDPVLQRAIRLRNPYVDPMSFLQVELLRRWRAGDRQDTDLERALAATVRGIARGLQNTG